MPMLDISWLPDASTIAANSVGPVVGAMLSAGALLLWGAGKSKPLSDFVDGRVKLLLDEYADRIKHNEIHIKQLEAQLHNASLRKAP